MGLWTHAKRDVLGLLFPSGRAADYERIRFPEFDVLFHLGLADNRRGVGRVFTGLRGELKKLAPEALSGRPVGSVPEVRFFPAAHTRCPRRLPPKSVLMVHDVTPLVLPELLPDSARRWREIHGPKVRAADFVASISEPSRRDMVRLLGIDSSKTGVVPNGITPLPPGPYPDSGEGPYFCFLGTGDAHKNLSVLFAALASPAGAKFRLKLVGAGMEKLLPRIAELGLTDRVAVAGRLDDAATAAALAGAVALVFPSLYEGFGLPPFEAALLGTPSICAARPALDELLAGAALFCDPADPAAWCEAMSRLESESSLRRELADRAAGVARSFTWERSARTLLTYLERVATAR